MAGQDGEVRVVWTGDIASVEAAHARMNRDLERLVGSSLKLQAALDKSSQAAEQAAGTSFDRALESTAALAKNVLGISSAWGLVQKAGQAAMAEYEHWLQRNRTAAETQEAVGKAEARTLTALGRGADLSPEAMRESALKSHQKSGVPLDQVLRVYEGVFQSRGGGSSKASAEIADTVLKSYPTLAGDEQQEIANAAQRLGRTIGGTPEELVGFVQQGSEASQIKSAAKYSKNVVSLVAGGLRASNERERPEYMMQMANTMAALMEDPEGRRSATALLQLQQQTKQAVDAAFNPDPLNLPKELAKPLRPKAPSVRERRRAEFEGRGEELEADYKTRLENYELRQRDYDDRQRERAGMAAEHASMAAEAQAARGRYARDPSEWTFEERMAFLQHDSFGQKVRAKLTAKGGLDDTQAVMEALRQKDGLSDIHDLTGEARAMPAKMNLLFPEMRTTALGKTGAELMQEQAGLVTGDRKDWVGATDAMRKMSEESPWQQALKTGMSSTSGGVAALSNNLGAEKDRLSKKFFETVDASGMGAIWGKASKKSFEFGMRNQDTVEESRKYALQRMVMLQNALVETSQNPGKAALFGGKAALFDSPEQMGRTARAMQQDIENLRNLPKPNDPIGSPPRNVPFGGGSASDRANGASGDFGGQQKQQVEDPDNKAAMAEQNNLLRELISLMGRGGASQPLAPEVG